MEVKIRMLKDFLLPRCLLSGISKHVMVACLFWAVDAENQLIMSLLEHFGFGNTAALIFLLL